jgi:hypothetical protein
VAPDQAYIQGRDRQAVQVRNQSLISILCCTALRWPPSTLSSLSLSPPFPLICFVFPPPLNLNCGLPLTLRRPKSIFWLSFCLKWENIRQYQSDWLEKKNIVSFLPRSSKWNYFPQKKNSKTYWFCLFFRCNFSRFFIFLNSFCYRENLKQGANDHISWRPISL